ncbi:MAG: hypothetical protein JW809_14220 [Pirellulales bacterium]|nr:hypothetical protein [Pirellulales bacterium]
MTLIELLMACAVMVIIAGTVGGLAKTVLTGSEYADGQGLAAQHAQVTLERIGRIVREATANESFPGAVVLAETVSGWQYPDTLVVWHPSGAPVDPAGSPRLNELVIFCPHPDYPNRLVQITAPGNTGTLSSVDVARYNQINAVKQATSSTVVTLTDLVRTAGANGSTTAADRRGTVRFAVRLRPVTIDHSNWSSNAWAQGIHGTQMGLRQVWVRTELQLVPGPDGAASGAIPFLDSAALYYQVQR